MLQWLFWQMGGLGPMAGQNGHFNIYAPEKVPYAIERYTRETERLYGVMDRRLADRDYLAGDYSIADMACYPWVVPHETHKQNIARLSESQALVRRHRRAPGDQARLCAGAGLAAADDRRERKILFGQGAKLPA